MINPFFENKGPFKINKILNYIDIESDILNLDANISDIKDLVNANNNEVTFFIQKIWDFSLKY